MSVFCISNISNLIFLGINLISYVNINMFPLLKICCCSLHIYKLYLNVFAYIHFTWIDVFCSVITTSKLRKHIFLLQSEFGQYIFYSLLFSFFCIVFFVKWHINLCRLFNAKAILLEEQYWYYLTHSWEDKGGHSFPKGICPKLTVIARLE